MGRSQRWLGDDEYVVVRTRTHVKALLRPALLLIVACGAAGLLAGLTPPDLPVLRWVIALVAAAAVGVWVLWPFVSWLGVSYTLTDRRLVTRSGVFTRVGRDIPLRRITDVAYERGLVDRVLGCGTLVIAAASENGRVRLHDVPSVEHLHLALSELLARQPDDRYGDDGYDEPRAHDVGRW